MSRTTGDQFGTRSVFGGQAVQVAKRQTHRLVRRDVASSACSVTCAAWRHTSEKNK
ncbi:hypothetical protein ACH4C2_38030 [Streptomyces sp. NPDC018057]|uniref:hypothetical protein n=1 Tax=unclassified Streptomyces TaxID=2593676 RepID=UPI0037AAB650